MTRPLALRPPRTALPRTALLWTALLGLCACAGRPPASQATPPIGAPAALVAWLEIRPALLDTQLDAFDRRVGDQTALGPLGVALRRARAGLEDRLTDLAPGGVAADGWAGWGINREAPLRIALAAPDGPDLGRALLDALDGQPTATDGRAVWRLRIVAGVDDAGRLRAGLDRLASRMGATVEQSPGRGWRARDASGLRLALTLRETTEGLQAALDVALPAGPQAEVDPLRGGEIRWPANLDGPLAGGLVPGMLASLESGLQAASALARTHGAGEKGRPVLLASVGLLTRCVERWQQAGHYTTAVVGALGAPDGRPRIEARVGLTEAGRRAWTAAVGPLPLATLDGLPAAMQLALDPAPFGGLAADWASVIGCAAGHALSVGPTALALAPALARPERLPVPGPIGGWPARSRALAAALVDAVSVGGQAVPTLAGLVRVGADHPVDPAPLGPDATRPTPEVHARPGPMPVTYGDHRNGDGRALIFGLGPGAHGALIDRLAVEPAPGVAVQGRVDFIALAQVLGAAGEDSAGVTALRAIGERFGRLTVRGAQVDGAVHWRLALDPMTAGGPPGRELDRAPPPQ